MTSWTLPESVIALEDMKIGRKGGFASSIASADCSSSAPATFANQSCPTSSGKFSKYW